MSFVSTTKLKLFKKHFFVARANSDELLRAYRYIIVEERGSGSIPNGLRHLLYFSQ